MKNPSRAGRRGAALVITLVLLLLLTVAALAFFSQVATESQTARTFSDSVAARQLADSAAGIVMSQIREATTVPNGAWASQPGMIRVYGEKRGSVQQGARFLQALLLAPSCRA